MAWSAAIQSAGAPSHTARGRPRKASLSFMRFNKAGVTLGGSLAMSAAPLPQRLQLHHVGGLAGDQPLYVIGPSLQGVAAFVQQHTFVIDASHADLGRAGHVI